MVLAHDDVNEVLAFMVEPSELLRALDVARLWQATLHARGPSSTFKTQQSALPHANLNNLNKQGLGILQNAVPHSPSAHARTHPTKYARR